jgi:hypothetical protein
MMAILSERFFRRPKPTKIEREPASAPLCILSGAMSRMLALIALIFVLAGCGGPGVTGPVCQ